MSIGKHLKKEKGEASGTWVGKIDLKSTGSPEQCKHDTDNGETAY